MYQSVHDKICCNRQDRRCTQQDMLQSMHYKKKRTEMSYANFVKSILHSPFLILGAGRTEFHHSSSNYRSGTRLLPIALAAETTFAATSSSRPAMLCYGPTKKSIRNLRLLSFAMTHPGPNILIRQRFDQSYHPFLEFFLRSSIHFPGCQYELTMNGSLNSILRPEAWGMMVFVGNSIFVKSPPFYWLILTVGRGALGTSVSKLDC